MATCSLQIQPDLHIQEKMRTHAQTRRQTKERKRNTARLCSPFEAAIEICLMRAIMMSEKRHRPEQNNNTDGCYDNNKDALNAADCGLPAGSVYVKR